MDNNANNADYLKQIENEKRKNKRRLQSSNKKSKKKKIEVSPSSRVLCSCKKTPAAPKYSDGCGYGLSRKGKDWELKYFKL